MEDRISNWITRVVGGSYIVLVIFGALALLIMDVARGDYDILYSPTTAKFTITGVLYILSLYLVGTLPGKGNSRRIYSWVFSIAFHAGLLLYIAIALEAGSVAIILGFPETIILILSILGLSLSVRSNFRK